MVDLPARIIREFRWNAQRLADPDSSLTPDQVRDLYSQVYPELTTAAVSREPDEDGKAIYALAKSEGKRGVAATAKTEAYRFSGSQGSRG